MGEVWYAAKANLFRGHLSAAFLPDMLRAAAYQLRFRPVKHQSTWKIRGEVYYGKTMDASLMVARPGQSLLRHTLVQSSNVSTKPRLTPAIFIRPKNAGWLVRDMSANKIQVVTRHVHIIDDPTLLLARLAASDDMFRRFGLPPGQSGVYHKAVRDLYASNPLADLDLSFVVLDPLSGAATRLLAAVDNEGNPMYMREAALEEELRPADQRVPGQNAASRQSP
jgi:hypothetical protein